MVARRKAEAAMYNDETEAKREARSRNYRRVREVLRARGVGGCAPKYRVMTVAGATVASDVKAIRLALPKSEVTAVDCSALPGGKLALERARAIKGVTVRDVNLFKLSPTDFDRPFDFVNLDLCGPVHEQLIGLVKYAGARLVVPGGVLSCTFLNGRDCAERFASVATGGESFDAQTKLPDIAAGMKAGMWGRIMDLTQPGWQVESVIYYRSLSPMVVVTWCVRDFDLRSPSFRYDVIGKPDSARAQVALSAAQKAWVTRRANKAEDRTVTCRWCGVDLPSRRKEYCCDTHYKLAWAHNVRQMAKVVA